MDFGEKRDQGPKWAVERYVIYSVYGQQRLSSNALNLRHLSAHEKRAMQKGGCVASLLLSLLRQFPV